MVVVLVLVLVQLTSDGKEGIGMILIVGEEEDIVDEEGIVVVDLIVVEEEEIEKEIEIRRNLSKKSSVEIGYKQNHACMKIIVIFHMI